MELRPIVKRPNYHFEYKYERKETKEGRGFSLGEIKEAKLTLLQAKKLNIRIDKRRKSVHKENVDALVKYVESINKKQEEKSNSGGKKQ